MALANQGYEKSLEIAQELGLNHKYLQYANYLQNMPFNRYLYEIGMKVLFKPGKVKTKIELFYEEEWKMQKLAKNRWMFEGME